MKSTQGKVCSNYCSWTEIIVCSTNYFETTALTLRV